MLLKKIHRLKLWRKKSIQVTFILFFILLFFLVVKLITPCKEFSFDGSHTFLTGTATENTVIYDDIVLQPGVYRIELYYASDTDLSALCNIQDGTVFTGGLLSNGEHIYSALNKTDFLMWLYEGTEHLQVIVSYNGIGSLTTGNLKITETNQLWSMCMTIVIFLAVVVLVGFTFYYYAKEYSVSKEKKHVYFCLMVIVLIASIPYLCGYNITGADLTYHLQRIEGVKDGLLGGQFPVRLEPEWVYHHGYADAIFYCNTFLYFPAILRLLGFTVSASYNIYCITITVATTCIAYYCFSRIFKNQNIGIICSALYTLSIFRIYKLIITTAVGEGSAVTFIPLALYGLYRVFTEDPEEKEYKSAWIPIMLGYAGLIQTHVLTCEITALVTILFCIANIRKIFNKNTFFELAKGALSAIFVSLWFLIPFLDYYITQDMHIRHVSARTIQESGLYWGHLLFHFWGTGSNTPSGENGMQYSHPVGIGFVLVVVLGIFLFLWFSTAFKKFNTSRLSFIKLTAIIGGFLMLMSLNVFPWDRIQFSHPIVESLVSSLQFPNRFLGWGTTCLILVFGFCLWYFKKVDLRFYRIMIILAVIGITSSSMYLIDHVNSEQNYYELYNEESMGFGYISGAEYLIEGTDIEEMTFANVIGGRDVEILSYEKDYLKVDLSCMNTSDTESYVDVPLLYYKGYQAIDTVTGQDMKLLLGDNNIIRIMLPANYTGDIRVDFVSPFYWRIGEMITLFTIIILIIAAYKNRRREGC